jgi:FixJ family two-component response regulator
MESNKNRPVIAIVDDNAFVRRAMQRLLCSLEVDAETFASGQEFIDLVEATPSFNPDCVILDVQMPGLNGLQVQERLSRKRRDIPVIFITASYEDWIREQALASGAAAFFYKPLHTDSFIETLHALLKDRRRPSSDEREALCAIAGSIYFRNPALRAPWKGKHEFPD